ncbi:MAG: SulP family inorganic anion transporter [Lautropia sp.]|nr:SulP family inorganic anion transporter [Lautropia sp.]
MQFNRIRFRPALLDSMHGYNRSDFTSDLGAGLTVACVALPLAMAFGIASGVKPEQGMITAIIGGLLISLLGGSKVQIGGPAGAFVAMLYGVSLQYGLANMLLATMMAGVVLFVMGALRMGQIVRFVPVSIVLGFTNGIAVVIMMSQLKDFLGLRLESMPADFFSQIDTLINYRHGINWAALTLGVSTFIMLAIWPKTPKLLVQRKKALHTELNDLNGLGQPPQQDAITEPSDMANVQDELRVDPGELPDEPGGEEAIDTQATPMPPPPQGNALTRAMARIPAPLVVLVFGTLAAWHFKLPVETIGSRFGGIPQTLPRPELPNFDWQSARMLLMPTMAIALLGAIESLLCARVADSMTRDKHDANQELMAQGIANFTTPLFGGIAVTGTIARTVTNIRSGGRTPVAGILHAAALLVFMLVLAPLAVHIPMAVLAGILMSVGFNMGDWYAFAKLRVFSNNYRTILLTTFFLTVIFDLTVAVEVGLLLAALFFIYRVTSVTRVERISVPEEVAVLRNGRRVGVWRAFGSLFFGSIGKIEAITATPQPLPDVVVLDMHQVINLDTTGLDALQALHRTILAQDGRLIISGPNKQPLSLIRRSGFLDELGEDNLFESLNEVYRSLRKPTRQRPIMALG